MSEKTKETAAEAKERRERQRKELDAAIEALPGDYTDADYVVKGMQQHFGDLLTAADEALVRDRVKPPVVAKAPDPSTIIKPTIGRKVWFWREGVVRTPDLQPEDATVCYVHGDSLVNLRVTEHNGASRSETEVSLRQPGDPEWSGRHCEWMPFQKGQAAAQEKSGGKG